MLSPLVFYALASFILIFALGVFFSDNPIFSAFSLVTCMIGLAFIYFGLGAYFLAAVQLAVYAGAVMVLFVMVLMLFNLKENEEESTEFFLERLLKITGVGVILGTIIGGIALSGVAVLAYNENIDASKSLSTKALAVLLFDRYIFIFEVLGVLLLAVAIGVVAISRIKGGSHDRPQ